jgi:hypothetical protein
VWSSSFVSSRKIGSAHRPARDLGEVAEWKAQVTGSLAARSIDEPQLRQVAIASILAGIALGDEKARKDAALAEEPLEALVRRCFPAFQRAARIGIEAC